MGALSTVLTVVFVIICIVLVLLILLQSNRSGGMSLFGGGGANSAFGSNSGDILTKITGYLAALFLVLSFSLALVKTGVKDASTLDSQINKKQEKTVQLKSNDKKTTEKTKGSKSTKVDKKTNSTKK